MLTVSYRHELRGLWSIGRPMLQALRFVLGPPEDLRRGKGHRHVRKTVELLGIAPHLRRSASVTTIAPLGTTTEDLDLDSNRFDSLTRSLLSGGSRRTLLGTAFAGVLGTLRGSTIEAKKKKKKSCPPCKKRKQGKCKKNKPNGTVCRGGSCRSGRCVADCPSGTTTCGGVCADLQTNE